MVKDAATTRCSDNAERAESAWWQAHRVQRVLVSEQSGWEDPVLLKVAVATTTTTMLLLAAARQYSSCLCTALPLGAPYNHTQYS